MDNAPLKTLTEIQLSNTESNSVVIKGEDKIYHLKKILYFDYWTKGIKNFLYFDKQLKNAGFLTRLVHFSSFKGLKTELYETIEGLDCVEIRSYKTNFLHKVIEKEAPSMIVILNIGGFLERATIITAKKLGIPVIYLSHGSLVDAEKAKDVRAFNTYFFNKYFSRLKRVAFVLLPNYLVSILKYSPKKLLTSYPYKIILRSFTNPARVIFFPEYKNAFDLSVHMAIVYSENDKQLLEQTDFPPEKIRVTGNPDFDQFLQQYNSGKIPERLDIDPYVLYIDESFVTDGISSLEEHISFLKDLEREAEACNKKFYVKLHPRSYVHLETYCTSLPNSSFFTNVNLYPIFYWAEAVISNYSSILLFVMLLDKMILTPKWSIAEKVARLYEEGIVTYCSSPAQLKEALMKGQDFDQNKRSIFLKKHIPFFDGQARERIVDLMVQSAENAYKNSSKKGLA